MSEKRSFKNSLAKIGVYGAVEKPEAASVCHTEPNAEYLTSEGRPSFEIW
jgi:hypothetical protein